LTAIPESYGTAVHEAGHIVVAWALGLHTESTAIGVRGDETAGEVQIADPSHLPLIDQIALCSAGGDAQQLLGIEAHGTATWGDIGKVIELIGDYPKDEGDKLRFAGFDRSKQLLLLHRDKLEVLARELWKRGELDRRAIDQILNEG
jgi:ATP-dependent Zn protease